jgi:hypothetical protein
METLSAFGLRLRVGITFAVVALLLYGTLYGQDDLFPFGPFRMYSTADKLDNPVADTRFEGVQADGTVVALNQDNTGIRRAEIEGQLPKIREHPDLLRSVDQAYVERNPSAPKLTLIRVIVRWHALHNGKQTGEYTDETAATWSVP